MNLRVSRTTSICCISDLKIAQVVFASTAMRSSEIKLWGRSMSLIRRTSVGLVFFCALTCGTRPAVADEGGVSFWIPGLLNTLAAAPLQPGWSFTGIYYHTSVRGGADVAFARQVSRGNITVPFTGNLNASLTGDADL